MVDESRVKSMIDDRLYYVDQELKELREKIEELEKRLKVYINED